MKRMLQTILLGLSILLLAACGADEDDPTWTAERFSGQVKACVDTNFVGQTGLRDSEAERAATSYCNCMVGVVRNRVSFTYYRSNYETVNKQLVRDGTHDRCFNSAQPGLPSDLRIRLHLH